MKFTLKNRPDWTGTCNYKTHEAYAFAFERWFEGFEKELREKIKRLEEADNLGDTIIADELKEILGPEGPAEDSRVPPQGAGE